MTTKVNIPVDLTLRYLIALLQQQDKSNRHMAHELGIDVRAYAKYCLTSDWGLARTLADKSTMAKEKTFADYVFKKLSPEAQETWKSLQFWETHKDWASKRDEILSTRHVRIKQELFIHALVATCYDVSRSCATVGVSKNTLDQWKLNDLHFTQLMEEIHFHKKNFFENAMIELVRAKNPLAVVWANKTLNADRGYSEKIRVEHGIAADLFDFESLDLDVETRRKVLAAIRRQQSLKETPLVPQLVEKNDVEDVQEAEIVEV